MIVAALAGEPKLRGKYSFELLPDVGNDKRWTKLVLSKTKFEVVVTGNKWVKRCLSPYAKVETPDFLRRAEYNATRIRTLILKGGKWKKLVPPKVVKVLEPILKKIVVED